LVSEVIGHTPRESFLTHSRRTLFYSRPCTAKPRCSSPTSGHMPTSVPRDLFLGALEMMVLRPLQREPLRGTKHLATEASRFEHMLSVVSLVLALGGGNS